MRQIAIYKKGRTGEYTTRQNLTAILATISNKILLVGCDPKADSTRVMTGGLNQKTVLDTLKSKENKRVPLKTVMQPGFSNIGSVESEPGLGCAGREIITSTGLLENDQSNNLAKKFCFYGFV